MLTLLMLLGFGMLGSMFIYVYVMGVKYINIRIESLYVLIFAHIFYFITFVPLYLVYAIILVIDSLKNIEMVKSMAYDKSIKMDDFMNAFEKYGWLLNKDERQTLPDKAFYVRNSK